MVEIHATLIGGSVFLAGEKVQVCVTVSAPQLDPMTSVRSSEVYEVIAWGSAQIHCVCTINDALVQVPSGSLKPAEDKAITNSATSFAPWRGERGHLVLATKPKILFCDLQLMPGQSRSFMYFETIPSDAPPSYRGRLVKYAYKVTVGTQKLGNAISSLQLPLRVIVLQGFTQPTMNSDTEDLAPSNPFLHSIRRESSRQTALHLLQNISTSRNMSQYNISHSRGHVGTLSVYKNSYRLGEDVVATFDFTQADVPCVQYSATLQSKETLSKDCCKKDKQKPVVTSYAKTHEVCLNFSNTNFMLPIPLHITPTFSTDLVKLSWLIHFEFVLNTEDESAQEGLGTLQRNVSTDDETDKNYTWNAPSKLKIETLVWDLPVNICPTSPTQLSLTIGGISNYSNQL